MADGTRPTLSTHVLDLATGSPAPGVPVVVTRRADGATFGPRATDDDGRIRDLLAGAELVEGMYELAIDVASRGAAADRFFVRVAITIDIRDAGRSYHVPLLVSPFGLTTYRGS